MTIAAYIRVGTAGQNESDQRREINRWLVKNGMHNAQYYLDKRPGDRRDFSRLQQDIFAGRVKTVVVYKLDRLFCSLRDGINVLCDWCDKGVRVVSVAQQIDFSGNSVRMLTAVLLDVAEMERQVRKERQDAGIAAAKDRGVYTGRPKGATKAGVDTSLAVELRRRGLTQTEIAKTMGVSVSSVRRYLKTCPRSQ